MFEESQIADFDNFFYYGSGDLNLEINSELRAYIEQDKRTMLYNREAGAGIQQKENEPDGFTTQIFISYDVINEIGRYNTVVTSENPDRRVASSQNQIEVKKEQNGEINVNVLLIPFFDFQNSQQINIPILRR